jgi:hypothetical protein
LFAARHRPAKESRGTAKKYQRCVRMSRHPPQLRWPKVFGRVESLDWRGLRDTSRSDRCLSMTPQRGNYDLRMLDVQRMLVARRRLQLTVKPGRFSGAYGGSFAYNHHGRDIDPRKFDHSPSVEQLERPPRSTTEKSFHSLATVERQDHGRHLKRTTDNLSHRTSPGQLR